MSDPIASGVSPRDAVWSTPPDEAELHDRITKKIDDETFGVCRDPRTVLDGMICGDETAVSNACRRAKPESVDAFLCDDKKLESLQSGAWDLAQKAIQLILGAKMGAK